MTENVQPVRRDEGEFEASHGTRLFWQSWTATDQPLCAVILVHGFGEHSGRYKYFVERLCAAGIKVFALDLRGHGKSAGRRGHVKSIADYRHDVATFKEEVGSQLQGFSTFIFGHSMGSLVVLDFVLRHPDGFAGTIISGVGLEPAGVATASVVFLARVLSVIWPVFPIRLQVDDTALTRDPTEIEAYNTDPLVHNSCSARLASELLNVIDWIKARPHELQLPILMVHGEADKVNLPSGSSDFISGVVFPDKELLLYPDGHHELHNDLDKEKPMTDITRWLLDRV